MQFVTDESDFNYSGKLHIRNLSVTAVPNDTIIFKKTGVSDQKKNSLPQIEFKKVNPTRYTVHVSHAVKHYALVFAEAYSAHWKVYVQESTKAQDPVTQSYFNDEISEGTHENTFFNLSYFKNGQSIAENSHKMANGYANVWNIQPGDVGNKSDYDLDVVYQPQIDFYYYLAISSVTFFSLLVLTIIFLIRKNEKK